MGLKDNTETSPTQARATFVSRNQSSELNIGQATALGMTASNANADITELSNVSTGVAGASAGLGEIIDWMVFYDEVSGGRFKVPSDVEFF